PLRIIAASQVIETGFVVETLGDLNEHVQVVRAQVKFPGRSFEEEAAVGPKFSLRVFAPVPAYFAGGGLGAHGHGAMCAAGEPYEHLARPVWQRAKDRWRHSHRITELPDCFFRRRAHGNNAGHGFERSLEYGLDMHRDQNE